MKDIILKIIAGINATVFMLAGCMIDSDSYVPAIVCLVSAVFILMLVPSIRRWAD